MSEFDLVVLGLSLSSAWGNGHATTFRALLRAYAARGHRILFLEREQPWYAAHRDLTAPSYCRLAFYDDLAGLERYRDAIRTARAVMVGSYVADGTEIGRDVQAYAEGVTAFYDIDTPVTLHALETGGCAYVDAGLIRGYDLYLSFSGGPVLERLETRHGARAAHALYCAVDPELYAPRDERPVYALGYLGTYSEDRQTALESLLLATARRFPEERFVVAGPQYPASIGWPANVERREHVPPTEHAAFYASCRFTLNVTRADMIRLGFSPSVRLFEAAACGTPVISDIWAGLETVFEPGKEILLAAGTDDVARILTGLDCSERTGIGRAARARVLETHTASHRAASLEGLINDAASRRRGKRVA